VTTQLQLIIIIIIIIITIIIISQHCTWPHATYFAVMYSDTLYIFGNS